jgi:tryptophan synthase alpha chain
MPDISERIDIIRTVTDLPLAVGFGISNAEHVKSVHKVADAAIIGSALVRRLGESKDPATSATQFIQEILQ